MSFEEGQLSCCSGTQHATAASKAEKKERFILIRYPLALDARELAMSCQSCCTSPPMRLQGNIRIQIRGCALHSHSAPSGGKSLAWLRWGAIGTIPGWADARLRAPDECGPRCRMTSFGAESREKAERNEPRHFHSPATCQQQQYTVSDHQKARRRSSGKQIDRGRWQLQAAHALRTALDTVGPLVGGHGGKMAGALEAPAAGALSRASGGG